MKTNREFRKGLISCLGGFVLYMLAFVGLYYLNSHPKNEPLIIITFCYLVCYFSFVVFMAAIILNEKDEHPYFDFGWFFTGYIPPFALLYYGIPFFYNTLKEIYR